MGRWLLCGTLTSLFGAVFLSLLGCILSIQPDFVHGLKRSVSPTAHAANCWVGAMAYATSLVVCVGLSCWERRRQVLDNDAKLNPVYELKTLQRSLDSWEDLGTPPRFVEDDQTLM
ncbi:hypothetical protein SDRG_08479 [Saprolegnia diclina VS20]|uniref:Uncharacterized protein n=1 Tax=Saprolegnia diclina (strain VS20) TaxID=1156394 RepID=T0QGB9_SAPDV|nr:hypothetical protein SDRG_08479 [Saprolegnia diclina VS20]EQC33796.1 hypothetical protein SDRG_08479 [Saprolegnia diclina VS20]|eukprot:XP_008612591.1 hypothetical protein SDRG_08479 [Saprolegnia diclina VS20]